MDVRDCPRWSPWRLYPEAGSLRPGLGSVAQGCPGVRTSSDLRTLREMLHDPFPYANRSAFEFRCLWQNGVPGIGATHPQLLIRLELGRIIQTADLNKHQRCILGPIGGQRTSAFPAETSPDLLAASPCHFVVSRFTRGEIEPVRSNKHDGGRRTPAGPLAIPAMADQLNDWSVTAFISNVSTCAASAQNNGHLLTSNWKPRAAQGTSKS